MNKIFNHSFYDSVYRDLSKLNEDNVELYHKEAGDAFIYMVNTGLNLSEKVKMVRNKVQTIGEGEYERDIDYCSIFNDIQLYGSKIEKYRTFYDVEYKKAGYILFKHDADDLVLYYYKLRLVPLKVKMIRMDEPIRCTAFQSYGGEDLKGNIPHGRLCYFGVIVPKQMYKRNVEHLEPFNCEGEDKFLSSLEPIEYIKKPYTSESKNSDTFYYVKVDDSDCEYLQVCTSPLNVLSENCVSEQNVWVPKNPFK